MIAVRWLLRRFGCIGKNGVDDGHCSCGDIESICSNRVARLAQLAGIKAKIGDKRRLGSYGGKPSVVVYIEPVNATGSKIISTVFQRDDATAPRSGKRTGQLLTDGPISLQFNF